MLVRKGNPYQINGVHCTVLGANGFIGSNLCAALVAAGAKVRGVGRAPRARQELTDKIEWHPFDLTSDDNFGSVIENTDVVIHLVSTLLPAASNLEKIRDIEENLLSTIKIVDCCRSANVRKFIYASSGGTIYGPQEVMPISEKTLLAPICSYGIVKASVESYLHLYRHLHAFDYFALRIANPYGPNQMPKDQGLIAALINKALRDEPIDIWGDGSVIRDYIYIDDLVSAIVKSVVFENSTAPRIYNIGSGIGRSVNSVLDSISKLHHKKLDVRYHPVRSVDVPKNVLDITLASNFLDWEPTNDWDSSIGKTYHWIKNKYSL